MQNLSFYVNEAIHLHTELTRFTLEVEVAGVRNWRLEKLRGLWNSLLAEEQALREGRLSMDDVRKNSFRRLRDFLWVNQRTGDLGDSCVRDVIIAHWLRLRDGVYAANPKIDGKFYQARLKELVSLAQDYQDGIQKRFHLERWSDEQLGNPVPFWARAERRFSAVPARFEPVDRWVTEVIAQAGRQA